MAFTPAPMWSFQNELPCSPSTAVPAASEAPWSVTGAVNVTSSPASSAPRSMRSRQSVWISPER